MFNNLFLLPGDYSIEGLHITSNTWENLGTDFTVPVDNNIPEPVVEIISQPSNCGNADGEVDLTHPLLSITDFEFSLVPQGSPPSFGSQTYFFNLPAGIYDASVRSRYNSGGTCSKARTIELFPVETPKVLTEILPATFCNGNDGQITLTSQTGPLRYSLNGGSFSIASESQTYASLNAGHYTVMAVQGSAGDAACEIILQILVGETSQDAINLQLNQTDASACGREDGVVNVLQPSAPEGYEFRLNGGAWQSDQSFTGLASGSYTVEVRDVNTPDLGCYISASVSVAEPQKPILTLDVTPPSACGAGDGTVVLNAYGADSYDYLYRTGGITQQFSGPIF
ncbi:MAG: hypothetical protein AAFU03_18325, partial [Bacteroidota bacterium]